MRHNPGVIAALALLACACDAGWLQGHGLRVIREVSVREGARLLEDPAALLLQVRSQGSSVRVEGTALLAARDPLPEGLIAPAPAVVILAEDLREGMAMAARLSRAGVRDVAVVRGGVAAWLAAPRGDPRDGTPQGEVSNG